MNELLSAGGLELCLRQGLSSDGQDGESDELLDRPFNLPAASESFKIRFETPASDDALAFCAQCAG